MPDVFQFYALSSLSSPPGKGTGETVDDTNVYKELSEHEGWRRILSNYSETPFVWKGLTWKTAEHAYRAWHLETKNATIFQKYSEGELPKASPIQNEEVLKSILHEKFTQNKKAKDILLLTGNAELWYAPPKSPKVHWTFLEEIREDLKRNLTSITEMSDTPVNTKVNKSKVKAAAASKKRITAQGGSTLPMLIEENMGDTVTEVPLNVIASGVQDSVAVSAAASLGANAAEDSKKSAIRFCSVCDNYLYLQVEGETQTLHRMCRNCGFKDTEDQGGLVSEMHIEQRAAEGYTLINEFTLKDKRLPHLHNVMKCINATCPTSLPGKESDIVYIKYDLENLRYIYMCYICQATWRSRR